MKPFLKRYDLMVKIVPLALAGAIAFGLKYHYSKASAETLLWILSPTAHVVEWLSGRPFFFEPSMGFVLENQGIVIAPACAGLNFLIIAFLMSFFTFSGRYTTFKGCIFWLATSFFLSYTLAIVVNSTRIWISIETILKNCQYGWLTPERVHRIQGVVINFFFLFLYFLSIKHGLFFCGKKGTVEISFGWGAPLFWYLLVALGVPVLTGNYREYGEMFIEHGGMVVGGALVVFFLFLFLRCLFLPILGGCGIKRESIHHL